MFSSLPLWTFFSLLLPEKRGHFPPQKWSRNTRIYRGNGRKEKYKQCRQRERAWEKRKEKKEKQQQDKERGGRISQRGQKGRASFYFAHTFFLFFLLGKWRRNGGEMDPTSNPSPPQYFFGVIWAVFSPLAPLPQNFIPSLCWCKMEEEDRDMEESSIKNSRGRKHMGVK